MPSRTNYRQWLSQELTGRENTYTVNASGNTTTTAVVDALKSSIVMDQRYQDFFLYGPALATADDRLRQIATYTASTGTLTVDRAVSGASVYNTAAIELLGHMHPDDIHTCINEALKRIPVVVQVNFAPVANNYKQDFTAQASWATSPRQVRQVYKRPTDGDQQQTITESGGPTGGTFTLSYRGDTTGTIAFDASAATVQTAVRTLAGLESATVTRTGATTNFIWVVTMTGAIDYTPILTADAALLTGGSSPAITPSITRDPAPMRPLPGEAVFEGQRVYLSCDEKFIATDRIYVVAVKRAYDHCRATSSGNFGDQAGLSAEAHEAAPPRELVGFGALTIAARRSKATLSDRMKDAIEANQKQWAAMFTQLMKEHYTGQRDATLTFRPQDGFGPMPFGAWRRGTDSRWW